MWGFCDAFVMWPVVSLVEPPKIADVARTTLYLTFNRFLSSDTVSAQARNVRMRAQAHGPPRILDQTSCLEYGRVGPLMARHGAHESSACSKSVACNGRPRKSVTIHTAHPILLFSRGILSYVGLSDKTSQLFPCKMHIIPAVSSQIKSIAFDKRERRDKISFARARARAEVGRSPTAAAPMKGRLDACDCDDGSDDDEETNHVEDGMKKAVAGE